MRRIMLIAAVFAALNGCASNDVAHVPRVRDVKQMPPGFAVMVATFEYVPGRSAYHRGQVADDARHVTGRLWVVGYQSFLMVDGDDRIRVGVRASSHAMALALERQIKSRGRIDLGDGNTLRVPVTSIVNLAELKIPGPAAR